jgi:predicted aminopeptidase
MTPKEKADKLIELFTFSCKECDNAKLCALIAVELLISEQLRLIDNNNYYYYYYIKVKQEIENVFAE